MTAGNGSAGKGGSRMAKVIAQRMSAEIEGEFVVFLIGMRINRPWKVRSWWPVFTAMPRMLKELQARPDSGFLGHTGLSMKVIVLYWRSFDHLEAYARDPERAHWPAWTEFNRRIRAAEGDVGIWHETYLIAPGRHETIYNGMPPFGLGKATRLVPATGNRAAARERLRAPLAGE